ncbi:MAG: nuclear transport factor 2 family protein [Rhizobacter sp.]|nr:nuclear transport factor 2 family protein [Ferruginibacter sp.]
MKIYILLLAICSFTKTVSAQKDKEHITLACLNYIEGFYEGDTTKLIQSLKPSLYKFGYWKDNKTGKYGPDGNMTYRQAMDYATGVLEKKHFAKPGSPKTITILDIGHTIAAAKVIAWWGIDYVLLSKQDNKWMIEQVLWEGPLPK